MSRLFEAKQAIDDTLIDRQMIELCLAEPFTLLVNVEQYKGSLQ